MVCEEDENLSGRSFFESKAYSLFRVYRFEHLYDETLAKRILSLSNRNKTPFVLKLLKFIELHLLSSSGWMEDDDRSCGVINFNEGKM